MISVKCPKCGRKNLVTNIKCENCGEKLLSEEEIKDMDLDILTNEPKDPVADARIEAIGECVSGIFNIIGGSIVSFVILYGLFTDPNKNNRFFLIPFLVCGIAVVIWGAARIVKGIKEMKYVGDYIKGKVDIDAVKKSEKNTNKAINLTKYIYFFGFFILWFGFLIAYDIEAIKSWNDGGNVSFILSLIFWGVGIFALVKNLKK